MQTTTTTPWTTKRTTPTTTRRTTPKPKPCTATNPKRQARIYLDLSSGMTVKNLPYSPKIAVDCLCNNNAKLRQQFWSSLDSDRQGASVEVKCKNKAALCIIPERGGPLVPKGVPPDRILLFPYCEVGYGCHMYAEHRTDRYLGSLAGDGWLGAVLVQPGGGRINEFAYYEGTNTYGKRPRGYKSAYIKAVAVNCGGCATVRNYASFTCPAVPSAKG